jgi:hypothetical protein
MTAKEKLRAVVEDLSETEAAEALGLLANRHETSDPTGKPEPGRRTLSFVGVGASTSGRTAAEAEDLLGEGFGR